MMNSLSKVLLLSITVTGLSYAMEGFKTFEEKFFEAHVAQLRPSLADFVNDFKTWPRKDQDAFQISIDSSGQRLLAVQGRPAAAHKYAKGKVNLWLKSQLNSHQYEPFVFAIEYLKNQPK